MSNKEIKTHCKSIKNRSEAVVSLIPFLIFIVIFLGAGIYYGDFYILPAPVAIFIAIVFAFFLIRGELKKKTNIFLNGCGDSNILTMCIIYLLAGAFATVSKSIGSVDAIVNIGIDNLLPKYYPAGIFLVASFLSLSSGTSVGTIVALGPIAMGLSNAGGCDINVVGAALLGGAMFGDNLSIISDTTIAATQMLGCDMRDKFRNNIMFALPAAVLSFFLYIYLGESTTQIPSSVNSVSVSSVVLIVPYLLVLLLAFLGLDVFLVLVLGIALSGVFGLTYSNLGFLDFSKKIYEGFTDMTEVFLLALLMGGFAKMVEKAGGIELILNFFKRKIRGTKSALLSIGGLVSVCALAIANNTISIVIAGKISKKIAEEYKVKTKVAASILDTFSCVVQGILPYGAQVLLVIGFSGNEIKFTELFKNSFYFFLLFVAVIVYIFTGKIKDYVKEPQD